MAVQYWSPDGHRLEQQPDGSWLDTITGQPTGAPAPDSGVDSATGLPEGQGKFGKYGPNGGGAGGFILDAWDKIRPGTPYDKFASAQHKGADQFRDLGREGRGYYEKAGVEALGEYDRAQAEFDQRYGAGVGPTDLDRRYQQQLADNSGPGRAEKLYDERFGPGASGYDPYSQMILDEGGARIDAEMAAGGGYGSGARLAAQAKFGANVNANIYREQFGEAQAAEQERQQREQYLSQLASGATSSRASINQHAVSLQTGISGARAGLRANTAVAAGGAYERGMGSGINADIGGAKSTAQGSQADRGFVVDLAKTAFGGMTGGGGQAPAQQSALTQSNPYDTSGNTNQFQPGRNPYDPDGTMRPAWA